MHVNGIGICADATTVAGVDAHKKRSPPSGPERETCDDTCEACPQPAWSPTKRGTLSWSTKQSQTDLQSRPNPRHELALTQKTVMLLLALRKGRANGTRNGKSSDRQVKEHVSSDERNMHCTPVATHPSPGLQASFRARCPPALAATRPPTASPWRSLLAPCAKKLQGEGTTSCRVSMTAGDQENNSHNNPQKERMSQSWQVGPTRDHIADMRQCNELVLSKMSRCAN